jgi:alkyldihydroxyacetonephosphate synthase
LPDWLRSFRETFSPECWRDREEELAFYSQDAWPRAIKLSQMGQGTFRPEVVFHARFVDEVPKLLAWANQRDVGVTVRGAGSGVVGACLATQGGILLDVTALNKILVLDEAGLFVTVGAGMIGGTLERELSKRGYTLHHSPQSLDRSTVGGWVATRACGQFSSRWGGIEDLLLAVTVALADGTVVSTPLAPRAAMGPDLKSLFIGSEGTLGVVLDATLRIFPVAPHRRLETLSFPALEAGISGLRSVMQCGLKPFLARLYDGDESLHVARWSNSTFPPAGNVLLLGFEGLFDVAEAEYKAALGVLQQYGATVLGPDIAQGWMDHRFDFSAVENRLSQPGGLAETIEVAHFWDGILELHGALKTGLAPLATEVLGHFSHAYPQGVSLYIILLGDEADAGAVERRLTEIWDVAMHIALQHGAAISHHHGIGLARQAYLREALGEGHVLLEKVKEALDPRGILNPGKLAFRR